MPRSKKKQSKRSRKTSKNLAMSRDDLYIPSRTSHRSIVYQQPSRPQNSSRVFDDIQDIQIVFLSHLDPADIIRIYQSSKKYKEMIDNLIDHPGFIVTCHRALKQEELNWFRMKNIRIRLLQDHKEDSDGEYWSQNGVLHRDDDEPSVIQTDGTRYWYKHGVLHRDGDQPAVIKPNGHVIYYQHGVVHRDNDLPDEILPGGIYMWHINGKLGRNYDLPAIETQMTQEWFQNGLRHRDGNLPAFIHFPSGSERYFEHGIEYFN